MKSSQRSNKVPPINTNLSGQGSQQQANSARNFQSGIRPPTNVMKSPMARQTPQGSNRSELQRRNTTMNMNGTAASAAGSSKHNGSNRLPPASAKNTSKKSGLIGSGLGGGAAESYQS